MLRAGMSKICITPPLGTPMSGQLFEREAKDIADDLFCRALVLDNEKTRVAFVACDVLSLKNRTVRMAKKLIKDNSEIPENNVIISATHTHTGPQTTNLFGYPANEKYISFLTLKIADAVRIAQNRLKEAKIGFGKGIEREISFNRRFIMSNGKVETHPLKGDPRIVEPEGPIDPEVGVLYVEGSNKKPLGGIVNFACHATCQERSSTSISADYPGYIEKTLEKFKGNDIVVLFTNGAAGNICQVDVFNQNRNEVGPEWAKRMGTIIGAEALKVIEKMELTSTVDIRVKTHLLELPYRGPSSEELKTAKEILKKGTLATNSLRSLFPNYGIVTEKKISVEELMESSPLKELWAREIILLNEERKKEPNIKVEITIMALNDLVFVAIPGELFVEFGLEIKRKSKYKNTFIIELANGCVGYIPTEKAFSRQGGYETRLACSSKLSQKAGRIIVNTALELIKQI